MPCRIKTRPHLLTEKGRVLYRIGDWRKFKQHVHSIKEKSCARKWIPNTALSVYKCYRMLKESSAASEIASLEYRTLLPPCKRISLMAQYLSTACRTQPSFVLGQRRVIGHIWCTMASSIIVLTKVALRAFSKAICGCTAQCLPSMGRSSLSRFLQS